MSQNHNYKNEQQHNYYHTPNKQLSTGAMTWLLYDMYLHRKNGAGMPTFSAHSMRMWLLIYNQLLLTIIVTINYTIGSHDHN